MKKFIGITVVVALLGLVITVISPLSESAPPKVSLPSWLIVFEKEIFGSKEFHAYTKTFIPIWSQLKPEYPDLQLDYLAAPTDLTVQQAKTQLTQLLGEQWKWAPRLASETKWGWAIGYENGDYVYVLLVVKKQALSDYQYHLIPAAIITNADLGRKNQT